MKNIKNNLTAVKEDENENVQTTSPKINENRSIDEISSINELNLDEENNEKNKINNYSNNFITTKIKNVQIYKVDNNKKNNFFKKIKNSVDENNHNNIKIISIINKNIEKIRKDSTPIKKILTDNEKIVNKFRKRNCDSFIEIKKTNFNTEINKKKTFKIPRTKKLLQHLIINIIFLIINILLYKRNIIRFFIPIKIRTRIIITRTNF